MSLVNEKIGAKSIVNIIELLFIFLSMCNPRKVDEYKKLGL